MTYTELQARAQLLAELAGFTNTTVVVSWTTAVNLAYKEFCWESECYRESDTYTTVKDQAEYTLDSPSWKLVEDVLYGDAALPPANPYAIRNDEPAWLKTASSTPRGWWRPMPHVLRLWPAPDTAGVTLTVYGVRTPAALSAGSDTPLVPDVHHEAIAQRAAWFVMEPWVRGAELQTLQARIDAWAMRVRKLRGMTTAESLNRVEKMPVVPWEERVTL